MMTFLIIIHVIVCIALISIVLLQHGKGAGIGAAFGGSSQTVFGSTGAAPFLAKLTAGAAIIFMITSLSLTFLVKERPTSVMEGVQPKPAPVQKAPEPTPAKPPEAPGK
jgi:preprotein translocase subunit SecG